MKKLFLVLLAAVMVFSLAACGEDNKAPNGGTSTPADDYGAEFTVVIGYGDEWTPFSDESGVAFANSENNVISITDDGTTVKFTGIIVGDSVITATLDGTEKKALVHVRAAGGDSSGKTDKTAVPLIRELPGSFYIECDVSGRENGFIVCLTKDSYSYKYFDYAPERYGWNMNYYTLSGSYDYWEGYGWIDTTDSVDWTSGKFASWSTESGESEYYAILATFRKAVPKWSEGAAVPKYGDGATDDISPYDTGRTETIAGVKCQIYEIDTQAFGHCTYWVEPDYHFCLKYVSGDDNDSFTITKYEVPFGGANPLVPQSGEVIHPGG